MKTLTIREFTREFGIGRTTAYRLLQSGEITAKKAGRRTLIERASAEDWYAKLPSYSVMGRPDG